MRGDSESPSAPGFILDKLSRYGTRAPMGASVLAVSRDTAKARDAACHFAPTGYGLGGAVTGFLPFLAGLRRRVTVTERVATRSNAIGHRRKRQKIRSLLRKGV
ncbi:hypothetical protein K474DRAFT_1679371 [Panus rudis PR-1116 ss-1]|nr:hypothetical protein K474DRAFT_1679371 [Panus rudis PR-1116 ss-1]